MAPVGKVPCSFPFYLEKSLGSFLTAELVPLPHERVENNRLLVDPEDAFAFRLLALYD